MDWMSFLSLEKELESRVCRCLIFCGADVENSPIFSMKPQEVYKYWDCRGLKWDYAGTVLGLFFDEEVKKVETLLEQSRDSGGTMLGSRRFCAKGELKGTK